MYEAEDDGNCLILNLRMYAPQTIQKEKRIKLHKTHSMNITRRQRKLKLQNACKGKGKAIHAPKAL